MSEAAKRLSEPFGSQRIVALAQGGREDEPFEERPRRGPMLEWWKDLVRPIRRTDPQFGKLRYLRDARFWEGRAAFSPIASEVEVLIPGEPSGPADDQRAFFNDIRKRYDSLWPDVLTVLDTEARRVENARRLRRTPVSRSTKSWGLWAAGLVRGRLALDTDGGSR
jgi:hypothetical protein